MTKEVVIQKCHKTVEKVQNLVHSDGCLGISEKNFMGRFEHEKSYEC